MRPHDHIGWVFSGSAEFAVLANQYLAEGASRGEKVLCVVDDPKPDDFACLVAKARPGAVQLASVAEVYGSTGIVDTTAQRATFASILADTLAAGFSALRVAADNSQLVADEERLKAWLRWEVVADRFVADNPATGMCAFNSENVDIDKLRHLATLHPLSSAAIPVPQFRMFSEDGNLYVEGELDSSAVMQLWLALDNLPPQTGVVVDLASVTLMSRAVVAGLAGLPVKGIPVTIRGEHGAIGELRASGSPVGGLVLQEV
jgi:MEDS: MEthanogen/methylotroph, DcmR Sensory domain